MSSFTNALVLRQIIDADRDLWLIVEPFSYEIGSLGSGEYIHIAAGTRTDLASTPWLAWVFGLTPARRYAQAAVVHDELCAKRGWIDGRFYTVTQASDIFREAMAVLGVNVFTRNLMHFFVLHHGPQWDRDGYIIRKPKPTRPRV